MENIILYLFRTGSYISWRRAADSRVVRAFSLLLAVGFLA